VAAPGEGEEKMISFLGFLFLLPPLIAKLPPIWFVLKAVIYRQNVAWASKLVPQLFFCKILIFPVFLYFFENEQYQRQLNKKNQ
jgi:hypothetical protein